MHWLAVAAMIALLNARLVMAAAPTSRATRPTTRGGATTASTKLATRRSANNADASREAIRSAVTALSREYLAYRDDLRNHPLRSSCDYFNKSTAAKISPEVLIGALNLNVGSASESAYVRWQLLSALPAKFDAATTSALIADYRAAPPPIPRPGVLREDQAKLDGLFKGKSLADEADVAHQWEIILDAAAKENAPILAYRDELYHRLPAGFETFAAAMDDLLARMNAVVDAKTRVKSLVSDVKTWAASESPSAEQLSALATAARRLADSKGPQYYVSAYWRESSSAFVWRKSRIGIDTGHELKDLATLLEEQSRQPELKLEVKGQKQK